MAGRLWLVETPSLKKKFWKFCKANLSYWCPFLHIYSPFFGLSVNVGEDCPVFDGLFEFCQLSAGGSAGKTYLPGNSWTISSSSTNVWLCFFSCGILNCSTREHRRFLEESADIFLFFFVENSSWVPLLCWCFIYLYISTIVVGEQMSLNHSNGDFVRKK